MNLQNFVELERLLQNGLLGWISHIRWNYFNWFLVVVSVPDLVSDFARAMSGSVPFEEALAARLSLFNPSFSQVQDFLEKRPPRYEGFFNYLVHVLTCLLNKGELDSLIKKRIDAALSFM
jgi:hypothetical protein